MTRGRLVALGAAASCLLAVGSYGRFAIGDEFEEHVADVLGLATSGASDLLAGARGRLGDFDYDARAAAFLAATTFPGSTVLPESARRDAIDALLIPMVGTAKENLVAIGLLPSVKGACGGLIRP